MVGSVVKNLPASVRDVGLIPGSGRSLREDPWEIPWTEEPGSLQSVGHKRVGHYCTAKQLIFW